MWWLLLLQLLVFLSVVSGGDVPQPSMEVPCDRAVARLTRTQVQAQVWDVVNAHGYVLPPSCPLHPERDMLLEQEQLKKGARKGKWKCQLCGKQFMTEHWIDRHLDTKHLEDFLLANPERDVCLADYCSVFQCTKPSAHGYSQATYTHATCDASQMNALQRKCSIMMASCFPYEAVTGKEAMTTAVMDSVCGMLTCDENVRAALRAKTLHFSGGKEWSVGYTIAAIFLCLGLFVFYAVMYSCGKLPGISPVQHKADFRRIDLRGNKKAPGLFSRWFGTKQRKAE